MLEVRNLTVRYGERMALKLAAHSFAPGVVHTVVGPNGAGKSTLLLCLAGLISPSAGKVTYRGRDITGRPTTFVRMALQRPALFDASVLGNVVFGLKCAGLKNSEAERRARHGLERLGVGYLEKKNRSQLSAGELHKVALARVLVLEPEVLLLDEPFAHLDEDSSGLLTEAMESARRERGATVICTAHGPPSNHQDTARVLFLESGRKSQGSESSA